MGTEQNVYLIGPMGVGKTTIGKSLARQLRLEFVDADQEIEKHTGVSIATIFDIEGEEAFRVRDKAVQLPRLSPALPPTLEYGVATTPAAAVNQHQRRWGNFAHPTQQSSRP